MGRMEHQVLSVAGSAGRATSATSCGRSVMAEVPALIALVSPCLIRGQVGGANVMTEFGLSCEYFRERKKRGKASRKDLAQQQNTATSATANPTSPSGYSSEGPSPTQSTHGHDILKGEPSSTADLSEPPTTGPESAIAVEVVTNGPTVMNKSNDLARPGILATMQEMPNKTARDRSMSMNQQHQHMTGLQDSVPQNHHNLQAVRTQMRGSPTAMSLDGFGLTNDYSRPGMHVMPPISNGQLLHSVPPVNQIPPPMGSQNGYPSFGDGSYPLMSPHEHHPPAMGFPYARTGDSPMAAFLAQSPAAGSPGWLSLPSPSAGVFAPPHLLNPPSMLRYPVLQPLIPHTGSILPTSLACDLLELYFTSSSSAHMHPLSPYLLGYVFRKRSFLHHTRPRACSPALLCSMLWVAAQTSDAPFLTSPPAARGRICQKLLELTVGLLRPLIHGPSSSDTSPNYGTNTVINGVALGGLGVAMPGDQLSADGGATGALDDVATYFHLATVISATEYKAASLRWWNAAWSLARELKLGRELPPNPPLPGHREQVPGDEVDADGDVDPDMADPHPANGVPGIPNPPMSPPGTVGEEEREERRRIWWLLYTVDRHLALCYNRPLFLLDVECDGLLQPIDDILWQAGEFFTGDSNMYPSSPNSQRYRRRGPSFECTGHSIFGYFLPLMTILGEIVDLNHARNHPRFGLAFRSAGEWDGQAAEITQQLEAYGQSLKEFEARFTAALHSNNEQSDADHGNTNNEVSTPSVRSVNSASSRMTESIIQTKIVVAYGTHVMHVLHILLTGKWDPISLLDDNDLWISSQSFISATGHAVSAAEAIRDILEYDPDLSFMPFFFGIYLLQGSFLLLLIADKLQGEASPSVVRACETIVRAHEACVVTLNTEYQVSFSLSFFSKTPSPGTSYTHMNQGAEPVCMLTPSHSAISEKSCAPLSPKSKAASPKISASSS